MRSAVIFATLLCTFSAAAPIGHRLGSVLKVRQDSSNGQGSTSTSTTNNSGLLGIGLVGGSASASDDGTSTSEGSTSTCGLLSCGASSGAAGPNGSSTSSSTGNNNVGSKE